ncbi:hypothetical protein [Epibacterium ulvae]|uniref:hypothetical protein n=1 Tax=Epibacterium ulvae TaxID=1156985 RepID=UPI0024925BF4|nr:hypothetical protein [Epibacterium ulvae]
MGGSLSDAVPQNLLGDICWLSVGEGTLTKVVNVPPDIKPESCLSVVATAVYQKDPVAFVKGSQCRDT